MRTRIDTIARGLTLVLIIIVNHVYAAEDKVVELAQKSANMKYLYIQSRACQLPDIRSGFLHYRYDIECIRNNSNAIIKACVFDDTGVFSEFCSNTIGMKKKS
jgi:hypothetical protein